jgi:hypothetical protein
MSLPKKEVAVWLSAESHAKLKALADTKNVSMGQYAAHWLEQAVALKFQEAVSVYRAVVSAGMYRDDPAPARKSPEDFIDSRFDPESRPQ